MWGLCVLIFCLVRGKIEWHFWAPHPILYLLNFLSVPLMEWQMDEGSKGMGTLAKWQSVPFHHPPPQLNNKWGKVEKSVGTLTKCLVPLPYLGRFRNDWGICLLPRFTKLVAIRAPRISGCTTHLFLTCVLQVLASQITLCVLELAKGVS